MFCHFVLSIALYEYISNKQQQRTEIQMNINKEQSDRKDNTITLRQGSSYVLNKHLKKKIEKSDKWVLDMGKYIEQHCDQMFANAKQASVQRMWIGFNNNPNILVQISQTKFSNLVQIWLTKNNISSIDILCTIEMPNLQQIHLRHNHLTTIRAMRRCNWPKIQVISIYDNFVFDLMSLIEMQAPQLNTIWTQYREQDVPQPQDIRWIAKLKSNSLISVCVTSKTRIKQDTFLDMLRKKCMKNGQSQMSIHLYQS